MVQTNFSASDGPSLAAVLLDIGSGADSATNTAYAITLTQALSAASESVSLKSGSSVSLQGTAPFIFDTLTVTGSLVTDLNFTGTVTLNNGVFNNVTLTGNGSGTTVAGVYTGSVLGTLGDGGDIAINNGIIHNNTNFTAVAFSTGTVQNGWNGPVTAEITATAGGVLLETSGLVQNGGTILVSGPATAAVFLGAGTVDNGQIGDTGATIEGNSNGVEITGAGLLANDGTILGDNSDAVYLGSGTVTNGQIGDFTALISGGTADNGVWINSGLGTVANFATILSGGASGVFLNAGGTVTNGTSTDSAALISGAFEGVLLGASGTLRNDGTVEAAGNDAAQSVIGAFLENGGSIGNATTAAAIQGLDWGGLVEGAAGTVTNLGLIQASSAAGLGVDLEAGGSIVNGPSPESAATISGGFDGVRIAAGSPGSGAAVVNGGTISGAVAVDFATGLTAAAGTLTNDGLIESTNGASGTAVQFGTGAETLVLQSAGVFLGLVLGGVAAGSSTTLELAAGTAGTLGAQGSDGGTVTDAAGSFAFSAIGTVAIDAGASWNVVAPGTMDTLVNAGGLGVSGGPVTIGGSLTNSGAMSIVGATLTAAAGILADPGVITVGPGGVLDALGGGIGAAGTPAIQVGGSGLATLTVSGAGARVNSARRLAIGSAGQGQGLISQGATVLAATPFAADQAISAGDSAGASGVLTVSDPGSKLQATGQLSVGLGGSGSLFIENQATVVTGNNVADATEGVDIGQLAGASGKATVTGGKSLLSNTGQFNVGDAGLGSLAIDAGGTVTTSAGAVIANSASGSGSQVTVTGTGSNWQIAGVLVVGNAGFGQLGVSQGATVTAGSLDDAAAAGSGGPISLSGTGTALNVIGTLSIGDKSAGSLNIVNGATVTAGALTIGSGAGGSGNVVIGPGSHLTLTTTAINVGVAGSGLLDVQGGTLGLVTGTTLSPGTFGRIVQVGGLIDPAAVFDASGGSFGGGGTAEASVDILNTSLATVSGLAETLLAPLITSGDTVNLAGVWSIKTGGTLVLDATTVDNSQTISFGDLTGELVIGQQITLDATQTPQTIAASALSGFQAPIVGYKAGDTIAFSGLTVASDSVTGNGVTLFDAQNTPLGTLTFQTAKGGADNAGAAAAKLQIVPCFAAGTSIETPDGPRAVETLAVGDEVRTVLGGPGRIVWVGARAVDCARHPDPRTVWPIRIAAGAFAEDVPRRDLFVSPDHAIYVGGALIPAKLLVNRSSIRQIRVDRIVYHHIELRRHDIVRAEGLTAETYLDVGDRDRFSGGPVTALYPEFSARRWEMAGCAPLLLTGEALQVVRLALAERAGTPKFATAAQSAPASLRRVADAADTRLDFAGRALVSGHSCRSA